VNELWPLVYDFDYWAAQSNEVNRSCHQWRPLGRPID
jgi:hypothetical protein